MIKRIIAVCCLVFIVACPVACVNDPTVDNSIGSSTDTDTETMD